MWRDAGRSRGNVRDPHSDVVTWLAVVKIEVLAVSVDRFAGIDGEPLGATIEIGL